MMLWSQQYRENIPTTKNINKETHEEMYINFRTQTFKNNKTNEKFSDTTTLYAQM